MYLPTQYIHPAVLRCHLFDGYALPPDMRVKFITRTVYDYELEFFVQSEGGIVVDGQYIPFAAGEINLRKPGQVVAGVQPYRCYLLCVDMVGNASRSPGYTFGCQEEGQERYDNPLLHMLPDKLVPRNGRQIEELLKSIIHYRGSPSPLAQYQERASAAYLFQLLFEECIHGRSGIKTQQIADAVRYIRDHFNEPIEVESLIRDQGMSKSYFHMLFLQETGLSPGNMITNLRVEKAQSLLGMTDLRIGEIGAMCGYADTGYFIRVFKKRVGTTPSAFRERIGWGR